MPSDLRMQIQITIANLAAEVDRQLETWVTVEDPGRFRQLEMDLAALGRKVADGLAAAVLQHIVSQPSLQARAAAAARRDRRLRSGGQRVVKVTLHGGSTVAVHTEYLRPDRRGLPGRRRQTGRRGRGGAGLYPVLAVLGIAAGVTPALGAEICLQVTDSDSVRAGRSALARRGIDLGHKQTLRIVNSFSRRAVEQRDRWLTRTRAEPARPGPLSGRRVAIAVDGGRLRQRCPATCGRRRKATGHRGYDAPWREPKLLTIYVLDDKGLVTDKYAPIYDGTLGDAEALFEMLLAYLKALGGHEAQQLVMLGDGAQWIWERCNQLVANLGIPAERVVQVIDWPHAVATLHSIAEARRWPTAAREAWLRRAKSLLHKGRITELLEAIDALAVGRRAKDVSQHRDYFARNVARMQYDEFVDAEVPTGSGIVESAIRRVINMRMKSNGMFWLEVNAQGMLLLRAYLKAGHFDSLVDWSTAEAIPWWTPSTWRRPSTPYAATVAA
jgi:hypothetical protein